MCKRAAVVAVGWGALLSGCGTDLEAGVRALLIPGSPPWPP